MRTNVSTYWKKYMQQAKFVIVAVAFSSIGR